MAYELKIKKIKEEMEIMLKQGQFPMDQVVHLTLGKLLDFDSPTINKVYQEWENEQRELDKKVKEIFDKYYNSILKIKSINVETNEPE